MRVAGIPLGVGQNTLNPSLTLALLHFDGANGSTTFTDSGGHSADFSITISGTPQHSNTSAESGFGNRAALLGNSMISIEDTTIGRTHFDFGTSPFTIEGRVEKLAGSQYYYNVIFGDNTAPPPSGYNLCLILEGNNQFYLWIVLDSTVYTITHQTVMAAGTKYHFAIVRSASGYIDLYINGIRANDRLNVGTSASHTAASDYLYLGSMVGNTLDGYIDEFRIRKEAVYTGASFTVPTAPFTE